jgi:hypothetical protein
MRQAWLLELLVPLVSRTNAKGRTRAAPADPGIADRYTQVLALNRYTRRPCFVLAGAMSF